MDVPIAGGEFVILTDVIPDVSEWPDLHACIDLLQALAFERRVERLTVFLTAAGQRVPVTAVTFVMIAEKLTVADDHGLRRYANRMKLWH
jgi:hypothetical protein